MLPVLSCLVAFRALLDNYESDTRKPETVTANEEQENNHFLDVVMKTQVMQLAHEFLVSRGKAPVGVAEFKQLLYSIWFKLYKRRHGDRLVYSRFENTPCLRKNVPLYFRP